MLPAAEIHIPKSYINFFMHEVKSRNTAKNHGPCLLMRKYGGVFHEMITHGPHFP